MLSELITVISVLLHSLYTTNEIIRLLFSVNLETNDLAQSTKKDAIERITIVFLFFGSETSLNNYFCYHLLRNLLEYEATHKAVWLTAEF